MVQDTATKKKDIAHNACGIDEGERQSKYRTGMPHQLKCFNAIHHKSCDKCKHAAHNVVFVVRICSLAEILEKGS